MYALDAEETVHIYFERGQEKRPYAVLPFICALLCLLGIATTALYSFEHPHYQQARLVVPAVLLPPKTFKAEAPIIPTGIKSYPATNAHGVLTITNGSIIGQSIPAGFYVQGVVTDSAVYVPGGSANGYGWAQVSAHALMAGKGGNAATFKINAVIGSSVYIRNLTAFTGGRDAYSVKVVTEQDKQAAYNTARNLLAAQVIGYHYPCKESHFLRTSVKITWRCQFATYKVPPYMRVVAAHLLGKSFFVDVVFVARPRPVWIR